MRNAKYITPIFTLMLLACGDAPQTTITSRPADPNGPCYCAVRDIARTDGGGEVTRKEDNTGTVASGCELMTYEKFPLDYVYQCCPSSTAPKFMFAYPVFSI